MGYVLWGHRGSGDHGWEDWVRGICAWLSEKPDVYSQKPEEDWRYGMGKLCGIYRCDSVRLPQDVCLIETFSGDFEGYGEKVGRRVLWGWSEEKLTREHRKKLRSYNAVVVSNHRTKRRLEQAGMEDKVYLRPDPTFLVKPDTVSSAIPIPPDTLGLCLSDPGGAGLFESYRQLIRWLLKETDLSLALIPYCVQKGRNDQILQLALYRQFRSSGRVFLRRDGSSTALRGDLSMCRCCVGFSGAVAAWGCGVPALCLTGNDRTKGLSHDIWGSSFVSVCPWQTLTEPTQLIHRLRDFFDQEEVISQGLRAYCLTV